MKTNKNNQNQKSNHNWLVPTITAVGGAVSIALGVVAHKAKNQITLKFTEMKLKLQEKFDDSKRQKDEEAKMREEERREAADIRAEKRKEEAAIRAEERREARRRNYNHFGGNNSDEPSGFSPSSVQNLSQINVGDYEGDDYYLLYKDLLSKGDVCVLFGPRGGGKTTLAMQLAKELCSGQISRLVPSGNFHTCPHTVLYYDGEHTDRDNVRLFGRGNLSEYKSFMLIRDFRFDNPQMWLKDVEERLRFQHTDAVVFLDNISCIGSTKDANVMRDFILNDFRHLQEELKAHGCLVTLVLLAHPNKEGDLAGSMNLQNFATTLLEVQKGEQDHVRLHVAKNRFCGDAQGKTFNLVSHKDENDWRYYVIEDEVENSSSCTEKLEREQEKRDKDYQLYLQAIQLYEECHNWVKVSQKMGLSRPTINKLREKFDHSTTEEDISERPKSSVA